MGHKLLLIEDDEAGVVFITEFGDGVRNDRFGFRTRIAVTHAARVVEDEDHIVWGCVNRGRGGDDA